MVSAMMMVRFSITTIPAWENKETRTDVSNNITTTLI